MRCLTLRRAKFGLFGFAAFLTGLILLADAGRGQWLFRLANHIPGGDKTGHFVLFGILAFLVNLVMQASAVRVGRITLLRGSLLVTIIAVAEEFSQLGFASRTFDLRDLAAGLLGIFMIGRLANWAVRRRRVLAPQVAATVQRAR